MSSVSFPVTRPGGRALVVGSASNRPQAVALLQQLGLSCAEVEDAYAAATELSRRPLVYRAMVLSLASLFREELSLIGTVKRRFPHVEVWLTHTDGRQAALAEAMRLGADGLLAEDGLHRTAAGASPVQTPSPRPPAPASPGMPAAGPPAPPPARRSAIVIAEPPAGAPSGEPVLSADELRALLQEQPDARGEP
jgi:hypothetical protein